MLAHIKMWLRQRTQNKCKHKYHSLRDEVFIGRCVNWGLGVSDEFQSTYECKKCGKQEIRRYYYFGNRNGI